jgi:hypothetical protein
MRLVIADDVIAVIANASEIHPDTASFRMTAFRHLGDYGASMPWSGVLAPPVDEPLTPVQ